MLMNQRYQIGSVAVLIWLIVALAREGSGGIISKKNLGNIYLKMKLTPWVTCLSFITVVCMVWESYGRHTQTYMWILYYKIAIFSWQNYLVSIGSYDSFKDLWIIVVVNKLDLFCSRFRYMITRRYSFLQECFICNISIFTW